MKNRILIVDDEESVLSTLKRLFRNKPYEVRVASSGEDALYLLNEESADLIISDMRMPEMDGAEFLSIVKQRHPLSERILLTGYSDMESTIKAINDAGIFGYLSKPWNNEQLLSLVENALEKSHKNRLKNRTLKHFKKENDALELDLERKQREMAQSAEFVDHAFHKLKDTYQVTEQTLLNLLDLKRKGERHFAHQVATLAEQVSSLLGLSEQESLTLSVAARLHGIGKIGVADEILAKSLDSMSHEERQVYLQYAGNGACALMSYEGFQEVASVIFEQCEYQDGTGYPNRLESTELSKLGSILCLIREYAELRHGKTTGQSMDHDQAMAMMQGNAKRYDLSLFPTLSSLTLEVSSLDETTEMVLPLFSVRSGMILNKDVFSDTEILLLPEGTLLTDRLIDHLMTIERNSEHKFLVSVRLSDDYQSTSQLAS